MAKLEKYNAQGKCPKCSSSTVSVEYKKILTSESMLRTCNNCGYQWKEAPHDAK